MSDLVIWLGGALLGFLALVGTYIGGKVRGTKQERLEADKRKAERDAAMAEAVQRTLEARIDAERDANQLPTGGAADRLRNEWARDD